MPEARSSGSSQKARTEDGGASRAHTRGDDNSSGAQRSHLASSPFKPKTEPVIERFGLHDRVSHQTYGLGRVVGEESAAVTVDFGNRTLRIISPFHKLEKL